MKESHWSRWNVFKTFKDAAPVIAKPITYIINLTISTGEIPPELKEVKVTP